MHNNVRIAVVPGDDAAPEAVHATLDVLRSMELPIEWVLLPDGESLAATYSREERERLIRETVDGCRSALFGATSGKTGGIAYLRWGKDTYANIRPIRWRPGFRSPLANPEGIDYVLVRENIEDLYLGIEGELDALEGSSILRSRFRPQGLDATEGRYAVKVITRRNSERIAHFACQLALRRKVEGHRGKVTCSAKYNVLPQSDGFFRSTVEAVMRTYPELEYEEFIVDDLAHRLVARPQDFDVIVLPNLYGDLLSDVGAATIGGLGPAPSGCYGEGYAYFEPVHGTAPDSAGKGIINPTATMLSAAMMLEYLAFEEEVRRLERAIEHVYADSRCLTPDQGGTATTTKFARAVRTQL